MTPRELADAIKSNIDAKTAAERYGFETNRAGFICCPFHNEKTPSLKLYSGDRGFSCFGCGTHGSVIDFVERVFNLSFMAACRKLNDDFCLSIPIDRPPTERERKAARIAEAARKEKRKKVDEAEMKYWDTLSAYVEAERTFCNEAPQSIDNDWSDKWIEAAKMRVVYLERLEEAQILWQMEASKA